MTFTKEEKVEHLQNIIKIKSENDHEEEVAKYIQALLAEHGIDSELVEYKPGRSSLVADVKGQKEGQGKMLVVSGHLDVVAAGDESEWTYPPFAAEIHDGKLYGRGASDMKAGVMALVLSAIELKEAGAPFSGTLRLALTVGEEIGMYGSKQLVEEGYADGASGFLIAEPSSTDLVINAHKGSIQYEIISKGKAAHSSMPELGVDALQLMVDYINATNKDFDAAFNAEGAENEQLGRTINVNTVINGGTQINSVASKIVLKANARTVQEAGNDLVVKIIEDNIAKLNAEGRGELELNMLQNNPSAESQPDNDLIKEIIAANDKEVKVEVIMGATDASNFGRIDGDYDLAIYGPGELGISHQVDEHVEVDEYLLAIDLYNKIIPNYLS